MSKKPNKEKTLTVNVKKLRELLADWHLDDEVPRKEALRYADRLINRMREECCVQDKANATRPSSLSG